MYQQQREATEERVVSFNRVTEERGDYQPRFRPITPLCIGGFTCGCPPLSMIASHWPSRIEDRKSEA